MNVKGKIFKGIGGFYYVHTREGDYECRAKGIFRNRKEKPLVGDLVELTPVEDSEKERTGNVVRILPRKNELIRPEVSNVDQAVVIFSLRNPAPSLSVLDRFLINMERREIPTIIFFNKSDLCESEEDSRYAAHLREIYERAGYPVLVLNTREERFREEVLRVLRGKTTVLSGPSGVGKSSITNWIHPGAQMETGELSRRIARGKNTTRHTEFFYLDDETYVLDTPGFTSLFVTEVASERLMYYYPEFEPYRTKCRYHTCVHIGESRAVCAVKRAVEEGGISEERYRSYRQLYLELRDTERY